jgi:hypothetical protein
MRTCPFNKSGAAPASVKLPTAGVTGVPGETAGVWPVIATDPASGVAVVAWPGICPVAKTDPVLGVTDRITTKILLLVSSQPRLKPLGSAP